MQLHNTSLVISNFNGVNYLKHTLPEWLKLFPTNRIFISDALSKDESLAYTKSLGLNTISGTIVGHKTNSLNLVLPHIRTPYVLFADNDILPPSELSLTECEFALSSNDIGILTFGMVNCTAFPPFNALNSALNLSRPISKFWVFPSRYEVEDPVKLHLVTCSIAAGCFFMRTQEAAALRFTEIVKFGIDDSDFSYEYVSTFKKTINLYSKLLFKHIGNSNRSSRNTAYAWRYFVFSHFWLLKRFFPFYIFVLFSIISPFVFSFLAFRQALRFKQPLYLCSFFTGYWFTFKHLNDPR
jgi:hypothetical protein